MDQFNFKAFSECPRCGDRSLEHLKTYCHCPNCLYASDLELGSSPSALAEIEALISKLEAEDDASEIAAEPELSFGMAMGW